MKNYLDLESWIPHLLYLNYEDLKISNNINKFLINLSTKYGLTACRSDKKKKN